jgi:arylsulfatase A-like enzyme
MGRGKLIIVLAVLIVLLAAFFWQSEFRWRAFSGKKPNVLLMVIDALRPDHLSRFGYSRRTSPFIDWLSSQGVSFGNAVSQSSWTKTSISSLLSSLYPEAHGMRGVKDVLPSEVQLISEVFKANGYRTGCLQANPWLSGRFGFNQGYDYFGYHFSSGAGGLNRRALEWIDQEPGRPFFLYIHYMDVHDPYDPPAQFAVFGDKPRDRYDGEILCLDKKLKAFYWRLRERNILKNTWIIITADHGEQFQAHVAMVHGCALYNEVLKVPLIFYHPALPHKGKIVSRQVRLIDAAPTLLHLANIPIPDSMEGVSLKRNMTWVFDFQRRGLLGFSQVGLNDRAPDKDLIAVSAPGFKYIFDFISGQEELYDLKADPQERVNIVGSRPDLAKSFRQQVSRFRNIQQLRRRAVIEKIEIDDESKEQLKSLGYLR